MVSRSKEEVYSVLKRNRQTTKTIADLSNMNFYMAAYFLMQLKETDRVTQEEIGRVTYWWLKDDGVEI